MCLQSHDRQSSPSLGAGPLHLASLAAREEGALQEVGFWDLRSEGPMPRDCYPPGPLTCLAGSFGVHMGVAWEGQGNGLSFLI